MKHCVIILDGASGWPLAGLGGKTTLTAARTPHLDALAREGTVGMAVTVPEGQEPSSSTACTSILGYDPVANRVGRGAIEAASMGVKLAPDEVALRMNLVHVDGGVMKSFSCGRIPTADSRAIVGEISEALATPTFTFHPGVAYRHILVVKGHTALLDAEYTPPHDISDKAVAGNLPRGPGASVLLDLMERARDVLRRSPVNARRAAAGQLPATDIWPFWPGQAPRGMVPFEKGRGVRGAMTSGVDLLNGLAVLAGLTRLQIAGVSDGPDNDYAAQAEGALAALADHDVVIVHVESPDEAGHAGDAAAKLAAIEAIDREIVSRVRAAAPRFARDGGLRILAMPDHPTPVATKTHAREPVPFVLAGPGIARNGADRYDEAAAAATGFTLEPGHLVMDRLLG
ncbi:MAG TPA: cofactor-independent phosphoglycerate mutase [Anaeromyxobacteraceae bacterium]|nr:cofactor-independent phosphoglycerate mutase [Anaeromyxobacteraceae bacterium]